MRRARWGPFAEAMDSTTSFISISSGAWGMRTARMRCETWRSLRAWCGSWDRTRVICSTSCGMSKISQIQTSHIVSRCPRQILVTTCVDFDLLAQLDEQRHLHHRARLQRCRLASSLRRISLHTRVRLHHLQLHCIGKIHADDLAVPLHHLHDHALFQILAPLRILLDANLLVTRHIHEHVVRALGVRKLSLLGLDLRQLDRLSRSPGLLHAVS
mmetsp:Transcript_9365/g.25353  ORF Transcript_9365/g.25353 Transcript_9365/m.25353 type:complete len:214 (-) Transcript_9365:261-902(-)